MWDDEGVLRRVAWTEVLPWLSLVRCVRLAMRFRALLLSALAILITLSGWTLLGYVFSGGDPAIARQIEPYDRCPWLGLTELVPDEPFGDGPATELGEVLGARRPVSIFTRAWDPLSGTWEQLSRPLRSLFAQGLTTSRLAFLMLCGLWGVMVWGFFGTLVARSAAVELAAGERIGWGTAFRFARVKWPAAVAAPLMPLIAALVAALLSAGVGVLLKSGEALAGSGSWFLALLGWIIVLVSAALWSLVLLGWALMSVLLLGLLFGWPLMLPVIAAEGTDSYDALSRSYNYLFSRPLHALFYALVAVGLGMLGWLLVSNFAAAVVYLSYWAAGWGGAPTVASVAAGGERLTTAGQVGGVVIRFFAECVKLLAVGFLYSYLWTAATGVYFLLRRDVDAREMDEVFLDEEPQPHGLPTLRDDGSGVPEVADTPDGPEVNDAAK